MGRNGLRPAEARALTWSALDIERRRLIVETQMDSDNYPDDVKTEESLRTIRLDSTTVDRLTAWQSTQTRMQDRYPGRWLDLDLVVTTRYGTAINRNNMLRTIK